MRVMGIFSKLSGGSHDVKHDFEEMYTQMYAGMTGSSHPEARSAVKDLIKQAQQESRKEGTDNFPNNFGDILLQREHTDTNIKQTFGKKRQEGVKDEDMRWWWNMHDLERRMMLKIDDISRMALFIKEREQGRTDEKAAAKVRKYFPMYGNPDDATHSSGDDRPLPYELKDRVNTWIQRQQVTHPDAIKKRIEESSSLNALVRAEIRDGRL